MRDRVADAVARGAAIASVALAVAILAVLALTRVPFFDEALRIHYLWLLSSGLSSNVDFFAPHPMPGFLLTLPLVRLLPESPSAIVPLRILSILLAGGIGALFALHSRRVANDWIPGLLSFLLVVTAPAIGAYHVEYSVDHMAALSAFGAIYLFFSEPSPRRIAAAAALAFASAAIMPKYMLPLMLGMSGWLLASVRENGRAWPPLGAAVAGVAIGALAVLLVCGLGGESPVRNFRYAFLLQYRYAVGEGRFLAGSAAFDPTLVYAWEFMLANPVAGLALAAGVAGWLAGALRPGGRLLSGGGGVLCGAIASGLLTHSFKEEYLSPVLLCLAFFLPAAFASPRLSPGLKRAARLLLALGTLATLAAGAAASPKAFRETPLNVRGVTPTLLRLVGDIGVVTVPSWRDFASNYERLLEIVPRNERVVAVWPIHPMFRRDLTFITYDEVPSHAVALPADDPLRRSFDPARFREALEAAPPALIATPWLEENYPPGWRVVVDRFLSVHGDRYVPLEGGFAPGMGPVYIRRDLAPRH